MFVIYINDLPGVVTDSQHYLFADDTKLLKGILVVMTAPKQGVCLLVAHSNWKFG